MLVRLQSFVPLLVIIGLAIGATVSWPASVPILVIAFALGLGDAVQRTRRKRHA